MEMRPFGKTGLRVSVLGFGGAEIGFEQASDAVVARLLGDALDLGLNVIDTAECYLDSEALIGRAVGKRRDQFHLFTKCGHFAGPGQADWSSASLLKSIARSLKRLKTDHVDLVQLHSCGEDMLRQGDVIAALQTARDKGYTRFIGYSGDGPAARFAVDCGQFDALQTSVSIADQEAVSLTLPLAQERGMGMIAKRPIANAAWRYNATPENTYHIPYYERLKILDYDFLRESPDQAAAVALRFARSLPIATMIVGTSKPGRWQENARTLAAGPLSEAQTQAIIDRWREVAPPDWVGQT